MESVLNQKNIVKKILTKLSKYGSIPNDGFLCGGAVANTLMSMEWGGNYPINDLDIFVESKRNKETNTPNRTDKLIIPAEYTHLNACYNHGNNYRIISSERDGFINVVKVFRENKSSKNFMYLLKGFDFNCTQVGIDLKTGELLYTPEFVLYLKNRQLKVVAPYTPGHTAIRLFKKIDELGCYCDIEGQMKLLSQPFNNEMMIRNTSAYSGVFGMYFSHKYKEAYDTYKDQLKEYFQLATLFEHKKWIWERRYMCDNQDKQDLGRNHVLSWLDPQRNPPQEALDSWSKTNGKIWGLIPVKYDIPDEEFVKVINTSFSPLSLMGVWGMLYGDLKKSMIFKVKTIFKYDSLRELCLVNDGFYDCDFDKKGCEYLNNAIIENISLGQVINKYNLNLQESITLQKDITKILNKEGKWFNDLVYKALKENGNSFIQPNTQIIKTLFEKERQKLTKPLVGGMDLSGLELPDNVEIQQLVSEYDLAYAGKKLSNCIDNPGQNYKKKVKSGKSKIFVITTPNSMSALEIEMKTDTTFTEKYLLSYCNRTSNQYHRQIGDYLKSYIERELILQTISDRLQKTAFEMETLKIGFNDKKDTSTTSNKMGNVGIELPNDVIPFDQYYHEPYVSDGDVNVIPLNNDIADLIRFNDELTNEERGLELSRNIREEQTRGNTENDFLF